MEEKMNKYGIILDGKMDEAVWEGLPEYTGFKMLKKAGGQLAEKQTIFKILPCEDRIYIGIKCLEPDRGHTQIDKNRGGSFAINNSVEIFLSPTGTAFDFYQFAITMQGGKSSIYYEEAGNIRPDPYAPEWDVAVHMGEDYWSLEVELPLRAFYMTPATRWNDKWLVNVTRNGFDTNKRLINTTWSPLNFKFIESSGFQMLEGFPMRPAEDYVCISAAMVDITEQTEAGYCGTMTIKTVNAVDGEFEFSSDHAETMTVSLAAGNNVFTVPCLFDKTGRTRTALELKRLSDGVVFKRYYPVRFYYDPLRVQLTQPEYRDNFYPGQDYSKVVGKVISKEQATVKLEGPGIETQTITVGEDGCFAFETPNFAVGEALLTVTIEGHEIIKKIRRLVPTGRTMSWISGGNLIVNGEPVLRRSIWARYYRGGEAFKRKYDADDLHETKAIRQAPEGFQARQLLKGCEAPGGEATKDGMPSAETFATLEKRIEECKDLDFVYYYIADEPECRGLSSIYHKHIYDFIKEKDPYHVVSIATLRADEFIDAGDWFEAHPYISPYLDENGNRMYGRQFNTLGKFVDCLSKLDRPDKCIGFVPTCYCANGGVYPTFDEYLSQSWAGMIRGGKTIAPYAYHDLNDRASLLEGTRYLFTTFEALQELVLFAKRTTLLKTSAVEAVRYDYGGKSMFVLLNLTPEPQHAVVEGISGTWHAFRHKGMISGNEFNMKPFEVVIGTSEILDAGIPTYEETAALINEMEYARTHRGSLLFGRGRDITITHSAKSIGMSKMKFFDGVTDNYAGGLADNVDLKFIELNVAKVNPTFNKVVLHGWHTEGVKLLTGKEGELTETATTEEVNGEFCTTLILKESVNTDVLRFEFPGERVEIYEIELF
ncbi:MAG: hypothetical protein IKB80_02020 [Oscillospiraceae bacterium]|nr:hypothetical protein [Oscillospiraceae bacterium]